MSGIKTATVEALTAEVRVLMVGSRQITLSVVRQLDQVSPEDLLPFGRVRAARQPAARSIEVVGSANGVLAYAVARLEAYRCEPERYGSRCSFHDGQMSEARIPFRAYRLRHGGPKKWYQPDPIDGKPAGIFESDLDWEAHTWLIHDPDEETYRKWEALPLIVLAGLR